MREGSVDVGGFSGCARDPCILEGSVGGGRIPWMREEFSGCGEGSEGSVDEGGYSGCGEGLGCSVDEGGSSGRGRIQWMGKGSVDLSVCVCVCGGGGGIHWPPRVSNGSHSPWSYTARRS